MTPPLLKPGDTVGIAATARKITPYELAHAVETFQSWGLKTVFPANVFKAHNQFSATDEERAADFEELLDNPEVKAIFCARGGYGSVRIVDLVNWDKITHPAKWIIGYSDVTVLQCHIYHNYSIASLHGPMAFNITGEETRRQATESIRQALMEGRLEYSLPEHLLNRAGDARGVLVGGNLSVLFSILDSPSFPDMAGKILFLEDLDEYLYHIDRMMMGLKRAGKLSDLAGLVIGGMTDMKDNTVPFGKAAEEIISDIVKEYNYPVYFNFPAGHIHDNRAIVMGVETVIENNRLEIILAQ